MNFDVNESNKKTHDTFLASTLEATATTAAIAENFRHTASKVDIGLRNKCKLMLNG
jgi:hypothetical protein